MKLTEPQIRTINQKAIQIGMPPFALEELVQPVWGTTERTGAWASYCTVTVPWCGMWLCIEPDGYCHT